MARFLRSKDIFSLFESMIREAREFVVIVSPFIDFDDREMARLLSKTADSGGRIIVIYRLGDSKTTNNLKELSDLPGIKIIGCPDLHAKIYATENAAIISSKNLTTRQKGCSIEIGVVYDCNEDVYDELVQTVNELLEIKESQVLVDKTEQHGYCIRCGKQIQLNAAYPLCRNCFDVWNMFRDSNYSEQYCHYCGNVAVDITYNHPIERGCYSEYLRAFRSMLIPL